MLDVTGLEMPMAVTPIPSPENMRPNSFLMAGSVAGPGNCGCAPCTAWGTGESLPRLRWISWKGRRLRWIPSPDGSSDAGGGARAGSYGADVGALEYAIDGGGGCSSTRLCGGG